MTTLSGSLKKPTRRRRTARIWHLVTNHPNMLYMLAADMVMSPAGFRGKYYSDSLELYPGWIPLFRAKEMIPDDAVNHATVERKHLLPCIASFDLSDLSGPVRMLSRNGVTRDVASPATRKRRDDVAILIRAPLPTTLLLRINFRSSADMQAFERAAHDVSNVDLKSRQLVVSESLFDTDTHVGLPLRQPEEQLFEDRHNEFPALGQALGGALAMLYHFANRSDLGLAVFRSVTEGTPDGNDDLSQSDPILFEISNWMKSGEISTQADTRTRIFLGVIQSLSSAQFQERPQTPLDVAIGYLEGQSKLLRKSEIGPRLERLIVDMRGCLGLGSGTITELLQHHKGSLSRPLLLFCLRDTCTDLLEFSHPLLNDSEHILAGILFGVRDGWLQIPKELRHPDVSAYVAYWMANAEHLNHCDSISVNIPPGPKPLRGFFTSSGREWNSQRRRLALELARKCKWNDCIQTRITLVEGNYPHSFERNALEVVLPGMLKAVTEEVDMDKFLRRLGRWPLIDPQIEAEIRTNLMNAEGIEEPGNENSKPCE
ncbi:MAG: hypothetical protein F4Y47_18495 [Acidobacteriia bacterium]|nr:hypothetical protein [Terriglobia bacterium]MYG01297.1 hypothetical protein [Terriglobia bacterium]MYK09229.1 hypothetical protein [Terriglobia bacterium]